MGFIIDGMERRNIRFAFPMLMIVLSIIVFYSEVLNLRIEPDLFKATNFIFLSGCVFLTVYISYNII